MRVTVHGRYVDDETPVSDHFDGPDLESGGLSFSLQLDGDELPDQLKSSIDDWVWRTDRFPDGSVMIDRVDVVLREAKAS